MLQVKGWGSVAWSPLLENTFLCELRCVGRCHDLRSKAHKSQHATGKCSLEPPIENSPRHTPHRRYLHSEASQSNPFRDLNSLPSSEANDSVAVREQPDSELLLVEMDVRLESPCSYQKMVEKVANGEEKGKRPVSGDMRIRVAHD